MAVNQGRDRNRRQTSYRTSSRRDGYVYGNTAPKQDVKRLIREEPKKQLSNTARKNRDKAVYMNLGYVMYLIVAMVVSGMVLIGYIQLQSEITTGTEKIGQLESTLNNLKTANDEAYKRATGNIDVEEIRRIAIGELGMTYAQEGQIILYSGESSDYVRQYADIP